MKLLFIILTLTLSFQSPSGLKEKTKSFKNNKRFSVEYDKFKDQTVVTVGQFGLSETTRTQIGNTFGIYARFLFPGQTIEVPVERLYLAITCHGREWQFLHADKVYALIDGERLAFDAQRSSEVGRSRSLYLTNEVLTIVLEPEVFEKLAKGKSVELKAGSFETKLKDEHLEALRDFFSLSALSVTLDNRSNPSV